MPKKRVTITMSEERYLYFKEHAEHHHRSMSNLLFYAMELFCKTHKLPRERKNG